MKEEVNIKGNEKRKCMTPGQKANGEKENNR